MGFVCPDCLSSGSLDIVHVIWLPPAGLSDDIIVQTVECSRCGFRAVAIYEESRGGALDSEASDHTGYRLAEDRFEAIRDLIAGCPEPRNTTCSCAGHASLRQSEDWWKGDWAWLRRLGVDPEGEFPMRWAGRGTETPATNATQRFLSSVLPPTAAWATTRLALRDVQGLYGGRNVFVSGRGRAVVQGVEEGLWERRYEFCIEQAEVDRLLSAFVKHDFLAIAIPYRLGIPDEAEPEITLINGAGDRHTVAKWAGQEHPAFDALYAELVRIEALVGEVEPTYEGPFQWEYAPEWFAPAAGA